MTRSVGIACLVLALASAGCGSGSNSNASGSTRRATTTEHANAQATLKRAVKAAIQQNFALSLYVLWHNQVPAWATRSTRGPALAGLRASATTRRRRDIRIRPVKTAIHIDAI